MAAVRIRVMRVIRELAGFYLLLLLVFVLHAYSFPDRGSAIYNIPLPPPAGIISGCILIARLLLVLFAGVVFSETTKHTRLTSAVHSLLGKVPFVPSFLIATMMGLAIMFVPVLLDTFHEISDALRSRCIDRMHNPIKKMVSYIAPLFVQIFIRTEEIAEAMESRCFNGTYTQPRFRITTGDIIVFACGIAVCIFSTFIGFLL
jgi:energy-coupling factor transporter transmembrane protein EcfT